MKEYIAVERQTDNGGYVEIVSELIRCKDCRHFREPNDAIKRTYCWYLAEDVNSEEDYCSWAERKEDDQTD